MQRLVLKTPHSISLILIGKKSVPKLDTNKLLASNSHFIKFE